MFEEEGCDVLAVAGVVGAEVSIMAIARRRAASPPVEERVENFWKEALRFEGMFTLREFWDMLIANPHPFFM